MTTNTRDTRVLELRKVIKEREKALGSCPKADYSSNLQYNKKNILVLKLSEILESISQLLSQKDYFSKAEGLVGITSSGFPQQSILNDLVLRGKILKWQEGDMEIKELKSKLDALRSEDLRVSDELDDLENLLK